jgi:hypothetical protein
MAADTAKNTGTYRISDILLLPRVVPWSSETFREIFQLPEWGLFPKPPPKRVASDDSADDSDDEYYDSDDMSDAAQQFRESQRAAAHIQSYVEAFFMKPKVAAFPLTGRDEHPGLNLYQTAMGKLFTKHAHPHVLKCIKDAGKTPHQIMVNEGLKRPEDVSYSAVYNCFCYCSDFCYS